MTRSEQIFSCISSKLTPDFIRILAYKVVFCLVNVSYEVQYQKFYRYYRCELYPWGRFI